MTLYTLPLSFGKNRRVKMFSVIFNDARTQFELKMEQVVGNEVIIPWTVACQLKDMLLYFLQEQERVDYCIHNQLYQYPVNSTVKLTVENIDFEFDPHGRHLIVYDLSTLSCVSLSIDRIKEAIAYCIRSEAQLRIQELFVNLAHVA